MTTTERLKRRREVVARVVAHGKWCAQRRAGCGPCDTKRADKCFYEFSQRDKEVL